MRIGTVVVTYNRKKLLLECLQALGNQEFLSQPFELEVLLIDNASTDGTEEAIRNADFPFPLHYHRLSHNQGGAGGFFEGVKLSAQYNYQWLWLMDDDAAPATQCLAQLLSTPQKEDFGFLAPRVIHFETQAEENHHQKLKIHRHRVRETSKPQGLTATRLEANAFVGVLIPTHVIEKVGLPDPSYFIWFDDVDYTYRISQAYRDGLYVPQAVIFHKDKLVDQHIDNWKHLFGLRNRLRFYRKFASPLGKVVLTAKTAKHIVVFLAKGRFYFAQVLFKELLFGNQTIDLSRVQS